MTDPVSGYTPISQLVPTPAQQAAAGGTRQPSNSLDKDAFLKLLVAQLKYQDPSKPVDSSEFMSQTAQFTQLEKLTTLTDTQTQLLSSQQLLGASSLVGRTVSYGGPNNLDVTGVVSSARFTTDGPVLHVGDTDVPLASVKEVKAPTAGA